MAPLWGRVRRPYHLLQHLHYPHNAAAVRTMTVPAQPGVVYARCPCGPLLAVSRVCVLFLAVCPPVFRSVVGGRSEFWESEGVRSLAVAVCRVACQWDVVVTDWGLCARWLPTFGGSCWRDEQKWQSDVMATKFDVDVTDPRTDGPRFNTFVTYNLLSTWHTSGVRRRYSDFEWLREVLKYRFHGTWVAWGTTCMEWHTPPLPATVVAVASLPSWTSFMQRCTWR